MIQLSIIIFVTIFTDFCDFCIPTQNVEFEAPSTTTTTVFSTSTSTSTSTTTSTTSTTSTTTSTTTTTPIPECPDSTWIKFDRSTYFWCMKIYVGSTGVSEMSSNCQSLNSAAVPTGFQNTNESLTILAASATGLRFWLGTYRTDACANYRLTAACNGLTSFYWTDGYTSGTSGFVWGYAQPDNSYLAQFYALIRTSTGLMDDEFDSVIAEGVICGMKAE